MMGNLTILSATKGTLVLNNRIYSGIKVRLKRPDGTIADVFRPVSVTPRDRSRYRPHQGAQEAMRRRVGGFRGCKASRIALHSL